MYLAPCWSSFLQKFVELHRKTNWDFLSIIPATHNTGNTSQKTVRKKYTPDPQEILNEAPHGQSPPINFRVAWPIKTRPHGQSPLIKFRVVWPIKIRPWKLFSGCNVETTLPAHADPQECNLQLCNSGIFLRIWQKVEKLRKSSL